MRLGVDMAFITVGALGLLEPIFCVEVLGLSQVSMCLQRTASMGALRYRPVTY
jgi:hypothetical protein